MAKDLIPINHDQVRNILTFIETTQTEDIKHQIFSQLGRECFHTRDMVPWIDRYQGDVEAFLDWVNDQQGSKYWENLAFNADHTALVLTGRVVEGCTCALADCPQPPLSLCRHCCKSLQEVLFSRLLEQKVTVEITESALLGGERCSTVIHLG